MINCEIKFDSPSGVYYAGQVLSGQIELNLQHILNINSLSVIIKGVGFCGFENDDQKERSSDGKPIFFEGNEVYINKKIYLAGKEHGSTVTMEGFHSFQIKEELPDNLPSSVELTFGHIRYYVIAVFDHKNGEKEQYAKGFTLLQNIDLNTDNRFRDPVELENVSTFSCFPCKSNMFFTVKLQKSGFVSGEKILIQIDVNNKTKRKIRLFQFILRQIIEYKGQNPKPSTKTELQNVLKLKGENIFIEDQPTEYKQELEIPSLPPSTLTNSGIIKISYDILCLVIVYNSEKREIGSVPITIGTVPLLDEAQNEIRPFPVYEKYIMGRGYTLSDEDGSINMEKHVPLYPAYRKILIPTETMSRVHVQPAKHQPSSPFPEEERITTTTYTFQSHSPTTRVIHTTTRVEGQTNLVTIPMSPKAEFEEV